MQKTWPIVCLEFLCVWILPDLIKDRDPAVLFFRQPVGDNRFINDFSVNTANLRTAKGRAFVKYEGEDTGVGTWSCSKDKVGGCSHTAAAREQLGALLKIEMNALTEETDMGKPIDSIYNQNLQTLNSLSI